MNVDRFRTEPSSKYSQVSILIVVVKPRSHDFDRAAFISGKSFKTADNLAGKSATQIVYYLRQVRYLPIIRIGLLLTLNLYISGGVVHIVSIDE